MDLAHQHGVLRSITFQDADFVLSLVDAACREPLASLSPYAEASFDLPATCASLPVGGKPSVPSANAGASSGSSGSAGGSSGGKFHPCLVWLNVRLGIDKVNPIYAESLAMYFRVPQFLGIIGGRVRDY